MEKERRTKALVLSALVVVVATLSIAFAAMSRTLSINGIGKMDTASWSVYFNDLKGPTIVRGAKSIIDKADGAMIAMPPTEKELKKVEPILRELINKPQPNLVYSLYKNRGGKWKTIIIWTKLNMGTMREVDCFVTDYNYEVITDIEKTIIDFQLDDVGNVGMIESDVDVSGSDLATELSK